MIWLIWLIDLVNCFCLIIFVVVFLVLFLFNFSNSFNLLNLIFVYNCLVFNKLCFIIVLVNIVDLFDVLVSWCGVNDCVNFFILLFDSSLLKNIFFRILYFFSFVDFLFLWSLFNVLFFNGLVGVKIVYLIVMLSVCSFFFLVIEGEKLMLW